MNVRPEAHKLARDYIDGAIRLQQAHGYEVEIDNDVYRSVVRRTGELVERSMRLAGPKNGASESASENLAA
jgi:hypothetical protein